MKRFQILPAYHFLIACLVFIAGFVFFFIFNRYQLAYQEQISLFRLNRPYFMDMAGKPGGLSNFAGSFITQFYLFRVAAAFLVTLSGILVYFLTRKILQRTRLEHPFWSLVPVLLLFNAQSNHNFHAGYTVALLLALLFLAFHLHITKSLFRVIFVVSAVPLLWYLAGGFYLVYVVPALIFTLFRGRKEALSTIPLLLACGFFLPWFLRLWLFNIPPAQTWTIHFPVRDPEFGVRLVLLSSWYPFLTVLSGIRKMFKPRKIPGSESVILHYITAPVLLVAIAVLVNIRNYDLKTELILKIDHAVQNRNWDEVLAVSQEFPGSNLLVTYYTNLALSQKGELSSRLFSFNQVGVQGLNLPWKSNNIAPMFGGEVYYYLGYNNEAYRWAFEAMEAAGVNPRSLKRLAVTSLINNDPRLAKTWLNVLDETLFYREWSAEIRLMADDPALAASDPEISSRRKWLITSDFWADDKQFEKLLYALLLNHPGNKTAYDYFMCYQLLEKDYPAFLHELPGISRLSYRELPRHFQEAFLAFRGIDNARELPPGFQISQVTLQNSQRYMAALRRAGQDRAAAAQNLRPEFGETFWYYFHFFNPVKE